jgi:hypothetical protein
MYTQSTTDVHKIEADARMLTQEYGGTAALLSPAWSRPLLRIVKSNQPQLAHFLARQDLPACQLIVSHGLFLREYVLGRYG